MNARERASGDEPGTLAILNVGAGDLKISFRPDAPEGEIEQARHLVEKMLREGYALLVETEDGSYARATGFDRETRSYIVSALPAAPEPAAKGGTPVKKKRGRPRKVAASGARAVAIGRSAGG